MSIKRTESQLDWERKYIKKIENYSKYDNNDLFIDDSFYDQEISSTERLVSSAGSGQGVFTLPDSIERAIVTGRSVQVPSSQNRTEYHKSRILHGRETNWSGFQSVNEDLFYFVNGSKQNFFSPEFASILILLHAKVSDALGVKKIQINSGYRSKMIDVEWDAHMGGYAVDIGVKGDDRFKVADSCWYLGLRAIAIGRTFVHVDAGPPGSWSYPEGPGIYTGPK